ncbi:MAG TPA: sugar ABC transporter substrate-binding protein [Fimbriimonadaceae bacterium]|nr:sugar ABC transporter substrate-binding protein [Fimbriimonadaceae bacterium]
MRFRILAALSLVLAAAGCGTGYPPGTIVLRIGNWGGAKEGNDYDKKVAKIYRDFEKENPGVVLQEENIPDSQDYVSKIALAYVAKSEPDVVTLDASSAALFIDSGIVTDLTPLYKNDPTFHLDDYFPNVVNIARRGDKLYAIPQDFTPMVVYYNKKLFDKAHVPYPTSNWNFEQFRETARRLTIPSPDSAKQQFGFAFTNWVPGWIMWIWNNGGDNLSPDGSKAVGYMDSPKTVAAVAFLEQMVKEGLAPSISQSAALGVDPFANGQAAMAISGHWSMIGYDAAPKGPDGKPKITWSDLGVVALPHNTPTSQTVMYEAGYGIGAHCKHRDIAWKFIRYMTSRTVQSIYQQSGIAVCARKDVADERAKSSTLESEFIPIIASARPPYGSRVEGYNFVEDQMQKAMDSIIQDNRDPRAALHRAALAVEREWQKR